MTFLFRLSIGLASLSLLLAANKNPVKNLLQYADGKYTIVQNQVVQASVALNQEDTDALVEMSAMGFKQYKFIRRKIFKKAINHTLTKHTKSKKKAIPSELETLLAKYKPQDVGDGYFIVNNRVVQKCQPLAREDFRAIQSIASRADAGGTVSDGVFLIDYVDQTIVKLDDKKGKVDPAVLARYAKVMEKYFH